MIGKTLSHYQVLQRVGNGGMSVIYKARDTRLGRLVALKFLVGQREDGQAFERLQQEARTASALNHPGICTIYDIDEDRGRPFIVMEFMEGQTLRRHLSKQRLALHQALGYGGQIADALGNAHAKGIVHRDINPSNLFITHNDRVKLLDFGIATLMSESSATPPTLTGTPSYMSPEQAGLLAVDARSDIFSLGVVLYEMLTSRPPFRGATTWDTIKQISLREPRAIRAINPKIPIAVEKVVNKCLRKSADERYQTAEELRLGLLKAGDGSGPQTVKPGRLPKAAVVVRGGSTVDATPTTLSVDEIIRDLWSMWPTAEE